MSQKKDEITYGLAVGIVDLFDMCYKRGVLDAHQVKDSDMCEEIIRMTDTPGVYGFLHKRRDNVFTTETWDERTWCSELWQLLFEKGVRQKAQLQKFISRRMFKPTVYLKCVMHISQEFYKQGLRDFNAEPHFVMIGTFLKRKFMEWNGTKTSDKYRQDFLCRIQLAANDRALRSEENPNKYKVMRKNFGIFLLALWRGLQNKQDWEI